MNLNEKLLNIQTSLKAPKSQYNSFGKYNYRNCEDILEAVKPLLKSNGITLRLTDDIVCVGERYYVKATAILSDGESEISTSAFAREEETKRGMDASQITGSASSYARKYALNGLFDIDDTKDSDTTNTGNDTTKDKVTSINKNGELTEVTKKKINNCLTQLKNITGLEMKEILNKVNFALSYSISDISTEQQGKEVISYLLKQISDTKKKGVIEV